MKSKKEPSNLEQIPGVGPSIAKDLHSLDIHVVKDLKDKDPEELYARFIRQEGHHVDRCVLYTFRCAVYFASHKNHTVDLLKWWNWKDR